MNIGFKRVTRSSFLIPVTSYSSSWRQVHIIVCHGAPGYLTDPDCSLGIPAGSASIFRVVKSVSARHMTPGCLRVWLPCYCTAALSGQCALRLGACRLDGHVADIPATRRLSLCEPSVPWVTRNQQSCVRDLTGYISDAVPVPD